MSNRTERLIRFYNRLRKGPVTIEVMLAWIKQADIQISPRQLYRDLSDLQHLNIATGENVVEFTDEKNRKTWKLEYEEAATAVTQYDINSFFLYKNFVPDCIIGERKEAFEKFEHFVYKQLSQNNYQNVIEANELYLRNTRFENYYYTKEEHEKIEDMIWALQNKRVVIIDDFIINPSNIKKEKNLFPITFYPMELLFHRGRVSISGIQKDTQKLLIYSVEKSLLYTLTNQQFNRKKYQTIYTKQLSVRFGTTEPLSNKVYNIKIEFTDSFGESTKDFFWHDTQQWYKLKNGNYMLEIKCCISREMIGWLMFGLDKLKVHQPETLKNLLVKKMQQTINLYTKNLIPNEAIANADY